MNKSYANTHVFYVSGQDLAYLKQSHRPNLQYKTKIVFDPSDFLEKDTENAEICQYYLNLNCKYIWKCKNYHPAVLSNSDCMICNAKVQQSLRKFGLLSGCQCVFCYPCIRQWRSRGNVVSEIANSCPICGIVSKELIPLAVFPANFSDKLLIFQMLLNKPQNDNI